jgi:small subunit ribosomal protein S21
MINKFNKPAGIGVIVKETENINQALRRFKKKVEESGKLEALREKECYDKPSIHRKKAKASAKARWRKKLREQQLPPKLY